MMLLEFFRLEHEIFRENDFTKNMANEKTTIHICTWARCSWNLVGLELEWIFFLKMKPTFIYAYR